MNLNQLFSGSKTIIFNGFFLLVLLHLFSFASRADSYVIRGDVSAPDGSKIFVRYEYNGKEIVNFDSVHDNKVVIHGTLPQIMICTLSNSVNDQVKIVVMGNENIYLKGTLARFHYLEVSDAPENVLFSTFLDQKVTITSDYRKQLKQTNTDFHDKKSTIYLDFHRRIDSLTLSFVKQYPSATASSLAIINSHLNSTDVAKAEKCYNSLSAQGKSGYYARRLKDFIDRSKSVQIGNAAKDFSLNNLKGEKVKLSDFEGGYLLLDFWASWCKPCREEHPMLKKLKDRFQKEKFKIVSVSMDTNDKNWKQAVADDGLSWTQLNDPDALKGSVAKSYSILALPFNCIIDPKGKILATKLRGAALEEFLSKIFPPH